MIRGRISKPFSSYFFFSPPPFFSCSFLCPITLVRFHPLAFLCHLLTPRKERQERLSVSSLRHSSHPPYLLLSCLSSEGGPFFFLTILLFFLLIPPFCPTSSFVFFLLFPSPSPFLFNFFFFSRSSFKQVRSRSGRRNIGFA